MELFPAVGLAKWARKFGLGTGQAQERTQWLIDNLGRPMTSGVGSTLRRICDECHLEPQSACDLLCDFIQGHQTHGTAGLMRRHIHQGLAKAALLGDESDLASFLTFGFAELEFNVRPSRQELVLALFKVLMEVFLSLKMPVVVAFDQLEDLLLARRTDDGRRVAEAFFAGIVQVMHQVSGICFLVFAERGLWNRFVPSLDGYIQDQLQQPGAYSESRHHQGSAPGSTAAGFGPSRRRGPVAAGPPGVGRVVGRPADDLSIHTGPDPAHRPHRADAPRHAPAIPAPLRPPRVWHDDRPCLRTSG